MGMSNPNIDMHHGSKQYTDPLSDPIKRVYIVSISHPRLLQNEEVVLWYIPRKTLKFNNSNDILEVP